MAERTYLKLFVILALAGAALDQVSKYGVFKWLYSDGQNNRRSIVEDRFELLTQFTDKRETGEHFFAPLRTVSGDVLPEVNQGALFGLGGKYPFLSFLTPEQWNNVFTGISLLAALAIVYWCTRSTTIRDRVLCAALGLILAGTLGNLYDRVVFGGVRDFLHFHWYDRFDWPVFNVADCCLVCGAFLLLAQAFLSRPVPAEQERTSEVAMASASAQVN